MYAIADKRKPKDAACLQFGTLALMGSLSHLSPGDYSRTYNTFLAKVVEAKQGRTTARWAERNMPKVRGKAYWEKLLRGIQAMTTEDIGVIADWLNMDPFLFIRAVKEDNLHLVPEFKKLRIVSSSPDDGFTQLPDNEEEADRQKLLTAAKRGPRK